MSQAESLRLDRLTLTSEGIKLTCVWRSDPAIYKWCRQYEPLTLEAHQRWYEWQEKDPHTKMYGVIVNDELVGVCGLTSIDWINRRAEFSLYIAPKFQGKGYGERALQELVKHGFQVLNLNGIWGEAFDQNPAIKMFERVGFKHEGTRRQFYYREGKYIDAHLFSLTKDEYDNR